MNQSCGTRERTMCVNMYMNHVCICVYICMDVSATKPCTSRIDILSAPRDESTSHVSHVNEPCVCMCICMYVCMSLRQNNANPVRCIDTWRCIKNIWWQRHTCDTVWILMHRINASFKPIWEREGERVCACVRERVWERVRVWERMCVWEGCATCEWWNSSLRQTMHFQN